MFNGEIIDLSIITKEVRASLAIENHREELSLLVIKLSDYLVILGISWLKKHNIAVL